MIATLFSALTHPFTLGGIFGLLVGIVLGVEVEKIADTTRYVFSFVL